MQNIIAQLVIYLHRQSADWCKIPSLSISHLADTDKTKQTKQGGYRMRRSFRNIQKWQEHVTQHVTTAVTDRNDIKCNTAERYALVERRTLRCRFFEMTVPCVLTTKASDLLERLSTCCVRADNKLSCNSTTQIINDQLLFQRTKFRARPLRAICMTESRNVSVSAAELYVYFQPSGGRSSHSP